MNNIVKFLFLLLQFYGFICLGQTKCGSCFVGLKDHLDSNYEDILINNTSENWISEIEMQKIKYTKDHYFKNNILAYYILAEHNWPGSDDSFELYYFAFFGYEFLSEEWAICVYKHKEFEIYNVVTIDVYGNNDISGKVINSRYFPVFHEELSQEYTINQDYQSGADLNFSGFSVFFKNNKINKVRILHDLRYLSNLIHASDRVR